MIKAIQKPLSWLGQIIAAEITKPLTEIQTAQQAQGEKIEAINKKIDNLHKGDEIAKECDLAMLDFTICEKIGACRAKGFSTEEDRRTVGRMHRAYKARGGNHGEENEYKLFEQLPTEEDFNRTKGESA